MPPLRRFSLMCQAAAVIFLAGPRIAAATENLVSTPLSARSGPKGRTLFTAMPAERTGIRTENKYDDPAMWGARFNEFELGASGTGVAIGDYDGDGRPDVFVVSKTESCRLFRNLGDWRFEDVTEKAGVGDAGAAARVWKQGATFVDINNDGLLDIYVCRFDAPNLLYINQGDGTFREMAHAYGLDLKDASVMAAFCDYDRDGRLDVFILTNLLDAQGHPNGQRSHLFHNNGNGTFTDVTEKAGMTAEGQGHSATWWDYDNDGWPDLYVAYDFAGPDKLYHNNRDGTFTNVIDQVVPHTPYSSMGSDLGDVNNDGRIDFLATDMAPSTHEKDQRSVAVMRRMTEDPPEGATVAPQYMRNALYVNTGTGRFLEAAELAGLSATDWTWSPRWEDLDDDGRLDLFVTNGMVRETHNADLIKRKLSSGSVEAKQRLERTSPVLEERHFAFRNLGDLRFEDVSTAWGLDQTGVAFGAAFGDLDGDGDLDIVYANYRGNVTVLRNDSDQGHRVMIALHGTRSNRCGVGAVVRIVSASGTQVRPLVLARGVLSSSEPILHFGLGQDTRIDRLTVEWPSGEVQTFENLEVDRRFTITEPTQPSTQPASAPKPPPQFTEAADSDGLSVVTREIAIDETNQQPLLPIRQNRRGPAVAIGDLNGDGRDDVVIGGTPADTARILLAGTDGRFSPADTAPLKDEWPVSDGPALVFDADGDGKNDLLLTKGGSSLPAGAPEYQPRLFLNDGHGGFQPAPDGTIPELSMSCGAAVAADFNRDGRLDVFLGARVLPGFYPLAPRSALLANRGGRFEDVTDTVAPELRSIGMVSSALWTDVDGDGWPDLLVALEWGEVRYFHNQAGEKLEDWTEKAGFASAGSGWWTAIAAADFNGDGRLDYVVGNVGLNTPYRASTEAPALLFVGDFADNGSTPLIEAYYEGGQLYPRRTLDDLATAIPTLLRRFPTNNAYAKATLPQILGQEKLDAARRFSATEFRSGVFLSQPDGTYRFTPLPRLAQISPVQGIVAGDFDGDGCADICLVQNSYAPIPSTGRFDGGLGLLLRGDGRGYFTAVPPSESGLIVPGDAKALAMFDPDHDGWPDLLVSRNDSSTLFFHNHGTAGHHSLSIRLHGPAGNPEAIGALLSLKMRDGTRQVAEVHAGGGYYSQSSAESYFGYPDLNPPSTLTVRWPSGSTTTHPIAPSASRIAIESP